MAYYAKFTERGQRALLPAQREAAELGRTYVGTEHLLLGVLTEPGGAIPVLKGITLDAVRNEVLQILGRGEERVEGKQMVYTPRTKKVLEQSASSAAVSARRRAAHPDFTGEEEFNFLMAVIFCDEDLFRQSSIR